MLGIIKKLCLMLWVQVYAMRKCLNLGTVFAKYCFLVYARDKKKKFVKVPLRRLTGSSDIK